MICGVAATLRTPAPTVVAASPNVSALRERGDIASLVGLVSGSYRVLDAVTDMVPEDLLFQTPQRRTRRCDLRDNINTISVFLDHAPKPAHLSFNPIQPLPSFRLDVLTHDRYVPLRGTRHNPRKKGNLR
jgi:hypothetical protein